MILEGDCVEAMAAMDEASVDAIVCDPPYAFPGGFMGRSWDRFDGREDVAFGYYLAGLIDGEGCFRVQRHKRGSHTCTFSMRLRLDDEAILRQAQRAVGVGTLSRTEERGASKPCRSWVVQSKGDCEILVGFLRRFPLRAKKRAEFEIWADAVGEWLGRKRGNRWDGPADQSEAEALKARIEGLREYAEPAWSGHPFQDWVREWAREAMRVLKPGGHLLAMGAPRSYHRLTAGIEDAGFEIRDSIAHLFGSGFPKSLNLNGDWQGWGTALKPAHEPIVVARKPLTGTVAANVSEHGTGALNVDGCRVGSGGDKGEWPITGRTNERGAMAGPMAAVETDQNLGRWPANVTLSHLPECERVGTRRVKTSDPRRADGSVNAAGFSVADDSTGAVGMDKPRYGGEDGTETIPSYNCALGCPIEELDRQSGELTSGVFKRRKTRYKGDDGNKFQGVADDHELTGHTGGDTGGASRFFLTVSPDKLCVLCGLPCVESAGNPSSPSTASSDSALDAAQDSLPPESADKKRSDSTSASGAGSDSRITPSIDMATTSTAPPIADTQLAEWIVQRVRFAASLCDSCETAIAQSVAQSLRVPTPESQAGPGSITEHRRQILSRSLALIAEGARSTGIIPTTATLSALCGSAAVATTERIPGSDTASATGPTRHRYCPKSSRSERNAGLDGFEERDGGCLEGNADMDNSRKIGARPDRPVAPTRNGHPTVKPIDLMRWLVRLVTPPGGTCLDPFAGSGTTGVACSLEGFDFIGCELDPEYAEIAKARIEWWSQFPPGTTIEAALGIEAVDRVHRESGQIGLFG